MPLILQTDSHPIYLAPSQSTSDFQRLKRWHFWACANMKWHQGFETNLQKECVRTGHKPSFYGRTWSWSLSMGDVELKSFYGGCGAEVFGGVWSWSLWGDVELKSLGGCGAEVFGGMWSWSLRGVWSWILHDFWSVCNGWFVYLIFQCVSVVSGVGVPCCCLLDIVSVFSEACSFMSTIQADEPFHSGRMWF